MEEIVLRTPRPEFCFKAGGEVVRRRADFTDGNLVPICAEYTRYISCIGESVRSDDVGAQLCHIVRIIDTCLGDGTADEVARLLGCSTDECAGQLADLLSALSVEFLPRISDLKGRAAARYACNA